MVRRLLAISCFVWLTMCSAQFVEAQQQAFGKNWGGSYSNQDWSRFYHYPYTYYPHNYWGQQYFKSADSMYYRYPKEMQIPVYNKKWHNFYPTARPYHSGHHFMLDVF